MDKYLPIGTVCTLKGGNKKIMITGFFSIEYNGNIKMYDYQGCQYPEGLLLKNKLISFNHSDIENIDFLGYQSELHNNLNTLLLQNTSQLEKDKENVTVVSNFQFDENGVIIFDGTSSLNVNEEEKNSEPIESLDNPFNIEYKPEDRDVNKDQEQILNKFVFDENGIIISDGSESIDTNGESNAVVNDNSQVSENNVESVSGYRFDENGVVISDGGVVADNNVEESTSGYKFDENGVIISDGNEAIDDAEEGTTSGYKFDENGIIISE